MSYESWVNKRLTEVFETNSLHQERQLDQLRLVLFSDLHKGQRDGADDFAQCEATYLAALDHYWLAGFELILLGDIEELWECRPKNVTGEYRNVLQKEQQFAEAHEPARYMRVVGNHDDIWYEQSEVNKHLGPYLAGAVVREGVRLKISHHDIDLGELFLVHGHQGTLDSDRYRKFSKWVVRAIWRPIQRFFRFKSTTPSNDFELRKTHERAMYDWSASAGGRVLIAGHTHHPVWEGLSYEQVVTQKAAEQPFDPLIEQAWMASQTEGLVRLPGEKPCYFNTGCCSYSDGTITGLEIEAGQIRLVRWEPGLTPLRRVLFSASLADVLMAVGRG